MYARLIVKRVVYKITHSLLLLLTLQEKWTEYSIENIKIAVNFRGDSVIVHQIPMRLKEYASSEEKIGKRFCGHLS